MSDTPRTDAETSDGVYGYIPSSFAHTLERELAAVTAELERERIRLAACGVVAMANTAECAARARDFSEEYRSASCEDVARAVDEQMRLRSELAAVTAERDRMRPVVDAAQAFVNSRASDGYAPEAALIDAVDTYEAATCPSATDKL